MRSIFAAGLVAAVMAEKMNPREYEFMKWISTWNKTYHTREEYVARLGIWLELDAFIKEVNAPDSEHTHTAGHNKFSDWTREEFKKMTTGLIDMPEHVDAPTQVATEDVTLQSSVDWTEGSCVTAVKNQEQCGSCYAFSATETVESSYCLHGNNGYPTNTLYTLSPQQIVDCSTAYGNSGCNGGWYYYAWNYLAQYGQEQEASYPYTGREGRCAYSSSRAVVKTQNGGSHVGEDSNSIMTAIYYQPVSVAVAANS